VGRIFGRWLLASLALGAVGGALYGALLAATLGGADGIGLVGDAPVAMVLGIGLGIGSMLGIVAGIVLGVTLGVSMSVVNRRLEPTSDAAYVRRVRVVATLLPIGLGLVLLVSLGRVATFDLIPVIVAAAVWGLAAKKIAEGYRGLWPAKAER